MEIVLVGLGAFAVFLCWTVVSLRMRRRYPGVGIVGGVTVLLLIVIPSGVAAVSAIFQGAGGEECMPTTTLADVAQGVAVFGGMLLVAAGVGAWQGRYLKLSLLHAIFGGIAECFPAMIPFVFLAGASGHGLPAQSPVVPAVLLLWVLAELVAPLVVAKLPAGRRRYPRTFYVSPE